MDRIQRTVDELKEQLERYSRRNPSPGSAHPLPGSANLSPGSCSSPSNPGTSEAPDLAVIQHFNTLGIDLKTFFNQMIKGDSILPFKEVPRKISATQKYQSSQIQAF